MIRRICLAVAAMVAVAAPALAQPLHFPDRGRAGVVDAAHVLPDAAREALNRKVVAWDRSTGHQLAVVTVPDLQGTTIADFGYQLGRAWGLGDRQRKDGVILLLAMAEHKVRIEVGYGLEGDLTDALTSAIIHDRIVPRLKEGDVTTALNDGADAIMAAASPSASDQARPAAAPRSAFPFGTACIVLLVVVAIGGTVLVMVRRRQRRLKQKQAAKWQPRVTHVDRGASSSFYAASMIDPTSSGMMMGVAAASRRPAPAPRPAALSQRPVPAPRPSAASPSVVVVPVPTPASSSRSSDSGSSSSGWGGFGSDSSSTSSSDSSSSSFGFDSGGGSFGGGGSDSSW